MRESLRERERQTLAQSRRELEQELLAQQLESEQTDASRLDQIQTLLDRVDQATPIGRLVIDLPRMLSDSSGRALQLSLQAGDELVVPRRQEEVTVVGEVNQPSSQLYREELTASDYIARSGGFNANADSAKIYVIASSGEVKPLGGMRWFFQSRARIEPGDTIVVPTDIFQPGQLQTWTSLSQVLFNLSTTLLALNSVGI